MVLRYGQPDEQRHRLEHILRAQGIDIDDLTGRTRQERPKVTSQGPLRTAIPTSAGTR
jgi:hypothetical protein